MKTEFNRENLIKALVPFMSKLQSARCNIVLNVGKHFWNLSFDVRSYCQNSITSAANYSHAATVADRLMSELS